MYLGLRLVVVPLHQELPTAQTDWSETREGRVACDREARTGVTTLFFGALGAGCVRFMFTGSTTLYERLAAAKATAGLLAGVGPLVRWNGALCG